MDVIDVTMIPALLAFIIIAEILIEQLFKPVREFLVKMTMLGPWLDLLTPYIAWVLSAAMVYFGQINVFGEIFAPLAGTIFTCVLAGCGSNRLHDLMSGDGIARKIALYGELMEEEFLMENDAFEPPEGKCCQGISS